eukprot:SAG22_NODE_18207_length_291_cov_0.796875_1_plen_29_part_01
MTAGARYAESSQLAAEMFAPTRGAAVQVT